MQRGAAGQHSGNVNLQPGLGIIPMLFGLNNNSGGPSGSMFVNMAVRVM